MTQAVKSLARKCLTKKVLGPLWVFYELFVLLSPVFLALHIGMSPGRLRKGREKKGGGGGGNDMAE